MTLYILRHGIAEERGHGDPQKDAARRLTAKGRRKLRRIARAMKALMISCDLVLSSPLVRARQTAELVARARDFRIQLSKNLEPGSKPSALVRELNSLQPRPKSVMLVGHEPDLSQLASLWVTGGSNLALTLKKGGLCKLEIQRLRNGKCGTLDWLLTPGLCQQIG